jgi:phosphopantothenoylcysteine decarboxylase/phosphopantothenate--cysteine ligase
MRFLVTAGPTREPIDPVRYLSNRSSGRMGYAIAAALRAAAHEVVLISGPVTLKAPEGVELQQVETALEMLAACQKSWPSCDGVFAVAAVADYRPLRYAERKLKRRAGEGRILELAPNPDILATLAAEKERRLAVGFALESDNGEMEARRKLEQKHLDFICLNGPEAQGAATASLLLISRDGTRQALGPMPKEELARALVRIVLSPRQG